MAIKVDPTTRRGRVLLWLAARLLRVIVGALGRSWRVEVVAGQAVLRGLQTDENPALLAFWHNRSVIAARVLWRQVQRRGRPLALLASESRDGELVAGLARAWGMQLVRGSTTRGGQRAMWGLFKAIRNGASPVVAPDGPLGPMYEVKDGILFLSEASGSPIVPLGFAADRVWRIRSWDRLIVPKPFARVAVALGEPWVVAATGDEIDARTGPRQRAKDAIDDATRQAEEAVGGSFAGKATS
ncbi:MAG: lysophospholipid acyltransferase family protein [Thermoanaerobaculia bacterium]|nr:lysophospholipid acyltransferase family protein [Thermoanaerobaculia bacterium]